MIIAVDERVPYWKDAFEGLGEVRPFRGRTLTREQVRDVDALIVRSITPVNSGLLEGSAVRFLATASVGMDHVDRLYLDSRGIYFANTAGSNAKAVAQYVVAALTAVAERRSWNLSRKSIAVVGVGHIGSIVSAYSRALGMQVMLCDPPLRQSTGDPRYRFLADVLDADILTFHVPLTAEGPHPTRHMVDGSLLGRLASRQFLVNTARGPVFSDADLKRTGLEPGRIAGAVLDVWENEPQIDGTLLGRVDIGTPHIAGFSLDGKIRGTEMVLDELCRFFNLARRWQPEPLYPKPMKICPRRGETGEDAVRSVVLQAYDILKDDASLRSVSALEPTPAAAAFDRLRDEYAFRPEFHHFTAELSDRQAELGAVLRQLGFQTTVNSELA